METINTINIAQASKDYMRVYGANKNLFRVIPSLQDGLKPGKRRLFWSWWESQGKIENISTQAMNRMKFLKVHTIAGNSMKYHPHSDDATMKMIGREGQYWSNNVMTIVPQGGYGSIRGDEVAAGRYIEAKMSQYTIECFFEDFSKYSVPMRLSYDGANKEPEYLPAKYPHLLFNPQFASIGYGDSSNIPPFNVTEVLKACIKLLDDPKSKIRLIPDSPTGCSIVDTGDFDEVNKNGQGKLLMRADYTIDYQKNEVRISSLPIQIVSKDVIENIISLINSKVIDGISEINDFTQNGEVNIQILFKSDVNPDKIMKALLKKKTGLENTLPISLVVIDDFVRYSFGVKDYLLEWLEFRKESLISRYNNELQQVEERLHMLKALIDITSMNKVSKTIDIIKASKNLVEASANLMNIADVTSVQADAIVHMPVGRFNREAHQKYKDEYNQLAEVDIKRIIDYLDNPKALKKLMISQFEEGIKRYGRPRKSKIVPEKPRATKVTKHLLGISENGFIKKTSYKSPCIGQIGKTYDPMTVMEVLSTDKVVGFDSEGNVQEIPFTSIPEVESIDIGIEIGKFTSLYGRIISVIKNIPTTKDATLVIVTKYGLAKRLSVSELTGIDKKDKIFISLNPGDEVVSVVYDTGKSTANNDMIIYTNIGNGVRIPVENIKVSGRNAKGTRQINLREDEFVVGASKIDAKKKFIFYITSAGKCKITELKRFPVMERNSESMNLTALDKRETLVGICSVKMDDVVLVFKRTGEPIQIPINTFTPTTRVAKCEKRVKTPKGDFVIGYKLFS